ncbi:MAG: nuclear transport factor 2 family protein [Solirubrobacterales bacterium]|nr:nuclear transport factor 2 family protein [Solirubrobacterales bacterium]
MAADHDSLMEAEHALQRAQLANDANALERLLHDHLRFVGPDGAVYDKAADLASYESGLVTFKASNPIEIEAHAYGTTGLTILLVELEVLTNGETVIGTYRYTRTWLYEDDRWQIVAGAAVPENATGLSL